MTTKAWPKATNQNLWDWIIGSGALSTWPWYTEIGLDGDEDGDWQLTFRDLPSEPVGDESRKWTVTPTTITRAMRKLAKGGIKDSTEPAIRNSKHVVFGKLHKVDFDACGADEVIQVAAFGEIVYG